VALQTLGSVEPAEDSAELSPAAMAITSCRWRGCPSRPQPAGLAPQPWRPAPAATAAVPAQPVEDDWDSPATDSW